MARGSERVLLDTNVLIYSTLENDPRHESSKSLLMDTESERYVSVQNLAEMYPNLTGPKMERPDSPAVARAKIRSIAALPSLRVLPLTGDVQAMALELCEKYSFTRQRYYDAQLVASMIAHGIRTILTENVDDFQGIAEVRARNPFRV